MSTGGHVSDLHDLLAPDLITALEELMDHWVTAALEGWENGSEPALVTIQEAAARIRVSPRRVEREIQKGRIRTSTLGRRRLIHREDLDAAARED